MNNEISSSEKGKVWIKKHPIITGVLVLFLIIFIAGISTGGSSDTAQKTGGEVTSTTEQPVTDQYVEITTLKGKGNQNTESFSITGKKVRITATTSGSSVGSFSSVELKKENGGYTGPGLSIMTEGAENGSGETIYRNLQSGTYYIGVISGINWEVKVEQSN